MKPDPDPEGMARLGKVVTVLATLVDWRKQYKGKNHHEIRECPVCKGRLHVAITAYNGHVRGHCETKDCVAWIE